MVCGWFRPAPFCSGVADTSGCLFCAFTRCFMLITDPEQSLRQAPDFKCTAKYALLTNTMTGTSWAWRDIRGSTLAFSFVAICTGSFVRLGGSWLMSPVTFSHVQSFSSIPDPFFGLAFTLSCCWKVSDHPHVWSVDHLNWTIWDEYLRL